ncbi:MAG: hypothetical protein PVG96_02260 [Desulfobacterales bacterium]|jgi:hypothetical protein
MRLSAQNRFFLNNISNIPLFIPKKLVKDSEKDNKGWNIGTKSLDSNTEVMRFSPLFHDFNIPSFHAGA